MVKTAEIDVLSEILRVIESTLKVPAEEIDIDANMETFGINSLIVMELMENVEKEFDVTLSPTQFSDVETVRDLSSLIESLLEEKLSASAAPTAAATAATPVLTSEQSTQGLPPHVMEYVRQRYGIDLSGRRFASVEELANALVSQHSGELMRHYGLGENPVETKKSRVAIVGLGCRLPDAENPTQYWANLLARRNSVREIPQARWNWEDYYAEEVAPGKTVSKWGALLDQVDCFDAEFFGIPAEEAASIDPQLRLLLEEAYHAVEDAGINMKSLSGSRTGVFIGYEYGEYEHHLRRLNNQDFTKGPLFSSSSPSYYLANRISHTFDLCGPSESYNVNCASSAVAINQAYSSLLNGESDVAIAGGASLNLFAGDYVAASQYGILSPDGTSGVFDDDAKGFTRGEGVGLVVLKRLADAERDGDRIYAVIRAVHENHRGAARNISEVKHEAITAALRDCYERAKVDLESIDYVEVDGYASKWADSFEYEGVKAAFAGSSAGKKHVALGSVKGNIGNTEPVSGVANVIKLALALHHKRFPATISVKKVNTFLDVHQASHPLYIADTEIAFDEIRGEQDRPIRAGVNSFADSGTNLHILLEEHMAALSSPGASTGERQLFVLSAKNAARLGVYVGKYIEYLADETVTDAFDDLIYTAQTGREPLAQRLAVVATSRTELLDKLRQVMKAGIKDGLGLERKGIYDGRLDAAARNPLAGLITPDMVRMQLTHSQQSGQWAQMAQLWVNGVDVPWATIWSRPARRRVNLPTYPFARIRHWVDIEMAATLESDVKRVVHQAPAAAEPDMATELSSAVPTQWYFYFPSEQADVQTDESGLSGEEKMTLFLRQEIALRLHQPIDDVSLDIDFIELGMSSIGIAEMIIKVDQMLQTNLSPSVIFQNPDISSLATYLARTHADMMDAMLVSADEPDPAHVRAAASALPATTVASPAEILIGLQLKGDRTPLFAVPGAGGNALSLQQISHALGTRQPFYCFDPVGLDGAAPLTSVEEMAGLNVQILRTAHPSGPYRLLGYSNGGIVAFDMARQLMAAGETVEKLVLLDSLAPPLLSREPMESMTIAVFNHFIASLGATSSMDVATLQAVPLEGRAEYLYDYAVGLGLDLPKRQFVATFEVATASEVACRSYEPVPLSGEVEVVLYRANQGFGDVPDDYGWNALISARLQVCEIAADHFNLLEKDPIGVVARHLNPILAKSSRKGKDRTAAVA
ncbi:beta-ketoacyl synthase N-terminal-like domain-containing protein [Bordetella tumulicola]|uniref:beta-ketoacyl synthase N-terminal-like domain-containing protein n=1 Tax=Bordetella tumulicola TaxID=1649133 RepID=UPI0039F0BC78